MFFLFGRGNGNGSDKSINEINNSSNNFYEYAPKFVESNEYKKFCKKPKKFNRQYV